MTRPNWLIDTLASGAIVVCWQRCGDLQAARSAARVLSAWTQDAVGRHLPQHRLYQSRSATPGLAAVAMSLQGPVGVDVERPGTAPDAALLGRVLHASEATPAALSADDFCWLWTRKEAALKALGTGLALPPQRLACGHRNDAWQDVASPWGGRVHLRSIEAPDGIPAAMACLAGGRAVAERVLEEGPCGWADALLNGEG